MLIREKPVSDSRIERNIAIGAITSTPFLKELTGIYKGEASVTQPYIGSVIDLCIEYFDVYNEAPNKHIQDIFIAHKNNGIPPDYIERIEYFLTDISEEYEEDPTFNVDYVLERAEEHFRLNALTQMKNELARCITGGRIEEGEGLISSFERITRPKTEGIDPLRDRDAIVEALDPDNGEAMFKMPGDLGNMMGYFTRGDLVMVVAPMGRGKCLTGDSQILLSDGRLESLKTIIDNKINNIISVNSNLKIVESSISQFYENGIKKIYNIKTRTGREIKITNNHPLLDFDKGWVSINDGLSVGDNIAVPKQISVFGNKQIPEDHIKLIAYLLADGGFTGTEITYSKKEKEAKSDVIRIISDLGDKYREDNDITISINKGHISSPQKTKTKELLINYGVKLSKSIYKEIPDCIFTLPKKQLRLFLNILFTGDGSIYNFGIEYSSGSEKLAKQVSHLLLRFGIVHKISKGRVKDIDHDYWFVYIRDAVNMKKFINNIGFSFSKQKTALKILGIAEKTKKRTYFDSFPNSCRKRVIDKIKKSRIKDSKFEVVTEVPNVPYKLTREVLQNINNVLLDKDMQRLLDADIFYDEISSISYIGEEETYDITVPNLHNFIANDICAHNTWWLQEMALRAMYKGYNVLFVSLEMSRAQMIRRIQHSITGLPSERHAGKILLPVFDCFRNQIGGCPMSASKVPLRDEGEKPNFLDAPDNYIPCTKCRLTGDRRYRVDTWFREISKEAITVSDALSRSDTLVKYKIRGGRLKILSPPPDSMNISGLKTVLLNYEHYNGWIPDIIITDYADKFAPEDRAIKEYRHRLYGTVVAHKSLASEKNCLVVSASQSNTGRDDKKDVGSGDFSEDIRKKAEISVGISLNQTPEDKQSGIMNIKMMKQRHDDFDINQRCMVLQQLKIGKPYLDSQLIETR